jgi:hypothetical protein
VVSGRVVTTNMFARAVRDRRPYRHLHAYVAASRECSRPWNWPALDGRRPTGRIRVAGMIVWL